MKTRNRSHPRQRRRTGFEFAMFLPQKAPRANPDWVDVLTNAEFAEVVGPSWAAMTERQRRLYPVLPTEELDRLWGMSQGDHLDAA